MHPAVLFSLVWFIILSLHLIFSFTLLDKLFPLNLSTYIIFFIGALAFSFGAFIQTAIAEKNKVKGINYISNQTCISLTLRCILLAIIIIGLPFYIQAAYRVFLASNIDSFFVGLRTELSYGSEDIGLTKYLVSFSFVVFAVNLYSFFKERNRTNKILLTLNLIVTLTYIVFVTGRGMFLMLLLLYLGVSFLLNKKFSVKKISFFFLLFLIFFIAIGIMFGKGGDTENTMRENITPALQTTAIYLVTPLNALDWEKHHQFHVGYEGDYSLRFFKKIAEQLNLAPNAKVTELVQPFVFVPYPTNVYTIYSPYIKDFGNIYAWLMLFLFGFINTFVYFKAVCTKNLRYSVYFSFLLFPLFMSFFQDQYLSLFSQWLQIVVYFETIQFVNKFLFLPND
jgi:oligosaccharide repeat unit polymerase